MARAWDDEIREILQRIQEDADFREKFFTDPEAALAEYDLSPRAERFLTRRVTRETFTAEYERFFADRGERGGDGGDYKSPALEEAALPPEDEAVPARFVNTGFAAESTPDRAADPQTPLQTDTPYYFWFEVGELVAGAIDVVPTELPIDKLPPEAELHVVLFSFEPGLLITEGQDIGMIKVTRRQEVRVQRPVARPESLRGDELLTRRLFFPVRTPAAAGTYRLRCSVYYEQTLVQSHLIVAQVHAEPRPQEKQALRARADFTLSRTLNGRQLAGMGQNTLSVMLNDNGDGTHGFRFFGQEEFKNDAAMGEGELADLIRSARGALRKAAWGDENPYAGQEYRYFGPPDEKRLRDDLVRFAIRGYRFYDALINRLAGDADRAWDLADMMRQPGQVQIASKETARLLVPAALFYDYPLDDGLPTAVYDLCPGFLDALRAGDPLAETDCFQGNCPSYSEDTVVCPSGFWGYRHDLGLPVSIKEEDALDAPTFIPVTDKPQIAVNVSTDPNFRMRDEHVQRLQRLGLGWAYADAREEAINLMKQAGSQVVYFYCHGGLTGTTPYLLVGPVGGPRITRSNLRNERIRWREIRPLVFINGCHTTALTPEHAIDFVSGFVEVSQAAGVIGTEITIYEPIAVAFAEECLRRFLKERQTIGAAVRSARLKMLGDGNPLGLVYIPYVLAGLKLSD